MSSIKLNLSLMDNFTLSSQKDKKHPRKIDVAVFIE